MKLRFSELLICADGELNYVELFKYRAKPISYALLFVLILTDSGISDSAEIYIFVEGRISDSVIRPITMP